MATRLANHVACVQVFGTLALKEVMNDLYYLFDHQPDHSDLVALTSAVAGAVIETWVPVLPGTWKGRTVFAFDMTVAEGVNAVNDEIAGVVGTSGGIALPNNVTLAVARKNGLRGRSGNGRIFWQGIAESLMADENHVGQPTATAYVNALKAADAAAVDVGGEPVILSFQRDGVVSTAATVYALDTWTVTDLRTDSRRKRLPKSGS